MAEVLYALIIIIISGILLANLAKFYKTSSVVPLLIGGMLLRYFGLIKQDFIPDLEPVIILTLSLVLFYAGLTIDLKYVIRYAKIIALLALVGVFLFTVILGYMTYLLGIGLSFSSAIILGAVLAPTDPAALFSIMESRTKVKRKLRAILIGESCFNDASAFVTVFIILVPLLFEGGSVQPIEVVGQFFWSIIGGAISGIVITYIIGRLIEQLNDPTTTRVLVLTSSILSYVMAESLHASGVIAALVAGILYGNLRTLGITPLPKRSLIELMESVNFIVEIFIFILLGSLINLQVLETVAIPGIIIALVALFVARPLVVFILTIFEKRIDFKERIFLSLAGAKGVTSGALALALASRKVITNANEILVLTFFTILATITFQALFLAPIIKKFNLEEKEDVLQELILKRNALREALLEIVDKYASGEISPEVYKEISSELKEAISDIEREIGELTESRRKVIEKLTAKLSALKKQIKYLDEEYNAGKISTDLYERLVSDIREEIMEVEKQLEDLKATKS